jgi:hypothetical protein
VNGRGLAYGMIVMVDTHYFCSINVCSDVSYRKWISTLDKSSTSYDRQHTKGLLADVDRNGPAVNDISESHVVDRGSYQIASATVWLSAFA